MMEIAFLIISHNRPQAAAEAVRSIKRVYPGVKEILVLDNGSHPRLKPVSGVKFFRSSQNLGVAEGRNFLARRARQPYLFFLDDDALLQQNIKSALQFLRKRKRAAVIAFNTFDQEGKIIWHNYRKNKQFKDKLFKTGIFVGAAFMLRKRVFQALGGFDRRFFYAGEEMDFCFRLKKAGYEIWHFPGRGVIHKKNPAGSPSSRLAKYYWCSRAHILFARKNLPWCLAPGHILFWLVYNFKHLFSPPEQSVSGLKKNKITQSSLR